MKRLVYSPKVYCFVRSNNQSLIHGKSVIYNVTDDIESGSVTRKVGDVSTAEIVLRNRFKKYTRSDDNSMIFMPNDMITIWLQRIAGKPIQQFTGYLDSAPYFQGYPGSCTLTATCTLKKLAYTWFDPGLPWFREWLQRVGGWILNPTTGTILNPQMLVQGSGFVNPSNTAAGGSTTNRQGASNVATQGGTTTNDGGFGHLLYEFLVHVANWAPENVLVSDLPADLPAQAAQLYNEINKEAEADLDTLGTTLSHLMSVSVTPQDPLTSSNHLSPLQERITKAIKTEADRHNIPTVVPVLAALLAGSGDYRPTYRNIKTGDPTWGFGLFALRPDTIGHVPGQPVFGRVDGFTTQQLMTPEISTKVFCTRLLAHNAVPSTTPGNRINQNSYLARANRGDTQAIKLWIQATMDRRFSDQVFQEQLDWANKFVSSWNTDNPRSQITGNVPPPLQGVKHLTWRDPQITSLVSQGDATVYNSYYKGKIYDSLAPYYWIAKTQYNMSLASKATTNDFSQLVVSGIKYQAFYNDIKGRAGIRSIRQSSPTSTGAVILEVNQDAPYPIWDGQKPSDVIDPHPPAGPDPTSQRASVSSHGLTIDQVATLSFDAAFFASTSLDGASNPTLSLNLTGDRALMNDVPVLGAIKQFCQASMREFMSLPDGRFLAFYPDYFGARRKHYWEIYDIEIVNLGIQLNDEQLATHVYVVGDTFSQTGSVSGESQIMDMVATRGVATIAQAAMLKSFIVPENGAEPGSLGNLKNAYELLRHYGARPLVLTEPIIHNTFFEFLMAWQVFMLKWASQFATNVEFTFQPEVMAGGLIQFPDHKLQMYVQQVTHSFDYSGGFSTSAVLTAPATTDPHAKEYPGFAIAGATITVGGAG